MSDTYDSSRRDNPEGTSPNTPGSGGWSGGMNANQATTGAPNQAPADGYSHEATPAAGAPAAQPGPTAPASYQQGAPGTDEAAYQSGEPAVGASYQTPGAPNAGAASHGTAGSSAANAGPTSSNVAGAGQAGTNPTQATAAFPVAGAPQAGGASPSFYPANTAGTGMPQAGAPAQPADGTAQMPAAPHTPTSVQKTEAVPPMIAPGSQASGQANLGAQGMPGTQVGTGAQAAQAAADPQATQTTQATTGGAAGYSLPNFPGSYLPPSQQYSGLVGDAANGAAATGKRKRSWTSAALATAAMAGLLFGGILGGLTGFAIGERDRNDAQIEQPQPSLDPNQQEQPEGLQPEQGVQQGERVKSAPGVVLVKTAYDSGQGAGTGMIIDKSGYVLTNYHVVTNSNEVTVTVADTKKQYKATVVGHNSAKDIALLKIQDPPENLKAVSIAKTAAKKGDTVSAIGNGSGQGYLTSLKGKVTALNQSITAHDGSNSERADQLGGLIRTDADVVPGYSGGPLMNADGKVVGVTTAASTGYTSSAVDGYAVPIKDAMEIVKKIRSGEADSNTTIGRNPALGVSVSTNKQNGAEGEGSGKGAVVQNVIDGSGAKEAGIQQGDIITHLEGKEVNSASELAEQVRKHKIGDKVKLKVTGADGNSREVEVKLGESTVN